MFDHDDEECRRANFEWSMNKQRDIHTIWQHHVPNSLIAHTFAHRLIPIMCMAILTDRELDFAPLTKSVFAGQKQFVGGTVCREVFKMGLDRVESIELDKLFAMPSYEA